MSGSIEGRKRSSYLRPDGLPSFILGVPDDADTQNAVAVLVNACHGRSWNAGWYHDVKSGVPKERNKGEMFALIHSEISEAMEAERKDAMDDKLTHRPGAPVELCDALIRIFDMLGAYWPEHIEALVEKLVYNDHREDHKPANRAKPGGKKF